MKLRYYLRGLGIGVLMTVVLLAIAGAGNRTMTDEEVKARARELGMVESKVLSNMVESTPEAATPKPEETSTPEPEETATPKPETTSNPDAVAETVTIVISLGDSSVSVSKDLAAAGLVESASAYDKYLCDNGYDRKIRTGTYEIPVGASEEEIALIITRKK